MLHDATTAAIREIDAVATDKFASNATDPTTAKTSGQATITAMLKTLLDDGIIAPLQIFRVGIINKEQDRRIARATVEPQLEHAAARIAAVVEAERPANRPTLKGLIHDDVDKRTEELRQSRSILGGETGGDQDHA